jgi:hypothetical protein
MRKARATTISLVGISLALFGVLPGEGAAQELTNDSLMGRWCTEGGAYVFTPTALTVLRTDGGKIVNHIASIDIQGASIVVKWQGKGGKTTFSKFEKDRMTQLPATFEDGSKSKPRAFHRC